MVGKIMIKVREEYIKDLRREIPEYDKLIDEDDIEEFLTELDAVIVSKLDKNYEPTKESHKYQVMYDNILNDND